MFVTAPLITPLPRQQQGFDEDKEFTMFANKLKQVQEPLRGRGYFSQIGRR